MGLGVEAMRQLNGFSTVLLPTLAAATAASGALSSASVQQAAAMLFADILMRLVNGLLVPLVCLVLFGAGSFLLPAMACILVLLVALRRPIESIEAKHGETEVSK